MLKDKIYKLSEELNNLFINSDKDIKEILDKKNIKTRYKKLSFNDVLKYKFLYAYKNYTKSQIVANLNFDNYKANKSNYYKKEQKIPLEYYQLKLNKVKQLFNNYSKKTSPYNIIAVDGTYNNTNLKNDKTLETTLNMGFYDVSNCIPIDIVLKDHNNKNKEIDGIIDYILKTDINLQKVIFVMDRAYFSYELIKLLNDKNIKFIIRIKNNCEHLDKNKKRKKKIKNRQLDNIRFISYLANITETKKNKKNENVTIMRSLECNIATNLDETYNDDIIKKMYISRWDIEVFFKLIKNNFKFSSLTEHNKQTDECYCKTYIIILIICILERLFEIIIEDPINTNDKYSIKYNKSLALYGLKKIILKIISSTLTTNQIINYTTNYLQTVYSEKNKNNPRISKRPFTWKT
jgi:hypothetical protein